jgi:hypothetical protein
MRTDSSHPRPDKQKAMDSCEGHLLSKTPNATLDKLPVELLTQIFRCVDEDEGIQLLSTVTSKPNNQATGEDRTRVESSKSSRHLILFRLVLTCRRFEAIAMPILYDNLSWPLSHERRMMLVRTLINTEYGRFTHCFDESAMVGSSSSFAGLGSDLEQNNVALSHKIGYSISSNWTETELKELESRILQTYTVEYPSGSLDNEAPSRETYLTVFYSKFWTTRTIHAMIVAFTCLPTLSTLRIRPIASTKEAKLLDSIARPGLTFFRSAQGVYVEWSLFSRAQEIQLYSMDEQRLLLHRPHQTSLFNILSLPGLRQMEIGYDVVDKHANHGSGLSQHLNRPHFRTLKLDNSRIDPAALDWLLSSDGLEELYLHNVLCFVPPRHPLAIGWACKSEIASFVFKSLQKGGSSSTLKKFHHDVFLNGKPFIPEHIDYAIIHTLGSLTHFTMLEDIELDANFIPRRDLTTYLSDIDWVAFLPSCIKRVSVLGAGHWNAKKIKKELTQVSRDQALHFPLLGHFLIECLPNYYKITDQELGALIDELEHECPGTPAWHRRRLFSLWGR